MLMTIDEALAGLIFNFIGAAMTIVAALIYSAYLKRRKQNDRRRND